MRGPDHIAIRSGFFTFVVTTGMMQPIMTLAKFPVLLLGATVAVNAAGQTLETVVVTGQRYPVAAGDAALSIDQLDAQTIAEGGHVHINELTARTPGAWVSRGSGQEHLTAIRSPVLTGAGSCGAFLVLEDGVPIRPAGLCNVNQLFEINTGQATAIEIARGPVSAAWGANALHGAMNVLMDGPRDHQVSIGAGPDDYYRARLATPVAGNGALLINIDHDGGFRADSGYDQAKVNLMTGGERGPRVRFAATRLQQETAGFVIGDDAWRDDALRKTNPNPEAYRDADAQRLSLSWEGDWKLTAYARHSRMAFLQHFLPGQPLERNGQHSLGAGVTRSRDLTGWNLHYGFDAELVRGSLRQTQTGPTSGSAFLQETRPAGNHYDYTVNSSLAGGWITGSRPLDERWTLQIAGRLETLGYDYDNRLADGNLRDDGSACGFGGCLYNRPADRDDRFTEFAPRIAVNGRLLPGLVSYFQLARGFRPPQATELYRLQRNQDVADLDSERLDSFETGLRYDSGPVAVELSGFVMRKDNFIFRDADGINVSDGRTRHHGIETALSWQPADSLSIDANLAVATHRYDFDRAAGGGETIVKGAEIDTAPRHLGGLRLRYAGRRGNTVELDWQHMGSYSMDAANSVRYPGHDLLNLRASVALHPEWTLRARVMNVTDRRYAERADFAFGNSRFFPGLDRRLYLDIEWRPSRQKKMRPD